MHFTLWYLSQGLGVFFDDLNTDKLNLDIVTEDVYDSGNSINLTGRAAL